MLKKIRDSFEWKSHKKGPKDKAIRELLTKFQRTGSEHDDSRNGRPRKCGERLELVREPFEEDPHLSTRRASNMLEIPRASIHRIIRCDLKKKKTIPHSGVSQLARRRLFTQSSNVR